MVNALRQTKLEDLSLQAALQEVLDFQGKHVFETHASLVEHTDAHEPANKSVTLKQPLGVLGVELQKLSGSTTNFGEDEGDAPDLALVAETVLAGELKAKSKTIECSTTK